MKWIGLVVGSGHLIVEDATIWETPLLDVLLRYKKVLQLLF